MCIEKHFYDKKARLILAVCQRRILSLEECEEQRLKACPLCLSTFEDNVRFCPYHGTELKSVVTHEVNVGDELDGYKILHRLSDDALGAVCVAEKRGTIYRFRVFEPALTCDMGRRTRLLEAIDRARNFSGGAVPVVDSGSDALKRLYCAQPFIPGVSLQDVLNSGIEVSEEQCCEILMQVLRALRDIHAKYSVHGCLRLSHIIIDNGGKVFIHDAGYWDVFRDENYADLREDRPDLFERFIDFMAPEVVDGYPPQMHSDVFSAGAVAYTLLAMKPPAAQGDIVTRIRDRIYGRWPNLREVCSKTISDDFIELLDAAMTADCQIRFQTPKAYMTALASVQPNISVSDDALKPAFAQKLLRLASSSNQAMIATQKPLNPMPLKFDDEEDNGFAMNHEPTVIEHTQVGRGGDASYGENTVVERTRWDSLEQLIGEKLPESDESMRFESAVTIQMDPVEATPTTEILAPNKQDDFDSFFQSSSDFFSDFGKDMEELFGKQDSDTKQAEREAREQAEREAREQAEREAREQAEREAREQAEREAREQAEREAREQAEREAREQAEREAREQAEREAREQAEREAREQAEFNQLESEVMREFRQLGGQKTSAVEEGDAECVANETDGQIAQEAQTTKPKKKKKRRKAASVTEDQKSGESPEIVHVTQDVEPSSMDSAELLTAVASPSVVEVTTAKENKNADQENLQKAIDTVKDVKSAIERSHEANLEAQDTAEDEIETTRSNPEPHKRISKKQVVEEEDDNEIKRGDVLVMEGSAKNSRETKRVKKRNPRESNYNVVEADLEIKSLQNPEDAPEYSQLPSMTATAGFVHVEPDEANAVEIPLDEKDLVSGDNLNAVVAASLKNNRAGESVSSRKEEQEEDDDWFGSKASKTPIKTKNKLIHVIIVLVALVLGLIVFMLYSLSNKVDDQPEANNVSGRVDVFYECLLNQSVEGRMAATNLLKELRSSSIEQTQLSKCTDDYIHAFAEQARSLRSRAEKSDDIPEVYFGVYADDEITKQIQNCINQTTNDNLSQNNMLYDQAYASAKASCEEQRQSISDAVLNKATQDAPHTLTKLRISLDTWRQIQDICDDVVKYGRDKNGTLKDISAEVKAELPKISSRTKELEAWMLTKGIQEEAMPGVPAQALAVAPTTGNGELGKVEVSQADAAAQIAKAEDDVKAAAAAKAAEEARLAQEAAAAAKAAEEARLAQEAAAAAKVAEEARLAQEAAAAAKAAEEARLAQEAAAAAKAAEEARLAQEAAAAAKAAEEAKKAQAMVQATQTQSANHAKADATEKAAQAAKVAKAVEEAKAAEAAAKAAQAAKPASSSSQGAKGEVSTSKLIADAQKSLSQKDYGGAIELLKQATAQEPSNHRAWFVMARAYDAQHNTAKAVECAKKACGLSKQASYQLFLGDMLVKYGDKAGAKMAYEVAKSLGANAASVDAKLNAL